MKFYSQNDPAWKFNKMGQSNATLGNYGCTTSCIATLGSYLGENIKPDELAKRLRYTPNGLLYWKSIDDVCKNTKFEWRFYTNNEKIILEALRDPDKVVLLNINNGKHWVSLIGNLLGMYKCSDPYPYPARTILIRKSLVVGGAILSRK